MKALVKKQIFQSYVTKEFDSDITIGQMVDESGFPKEVHDYVQVRVNGQLVNRKYWYYARPNKNTNVAIALVPAGGTNDILRSITQLAFIAAGSFIAPSLVGASILGKVLITTTAAMIGSLVSRSLFPPASLDQPSAKRPEKLNVITGQSNSADPNGVVIRNYGRNKIFPRLIAQPFTYSVGKDQYIINLYDFGTGRQFINESSISIGENPLSAYKDVQINIANNPDDLELYKKRINTLFPNFTFEDIGDSFTQTTPQNTDHIGIVLTWPQGLTGYYGSKFKRTTMTQSFRVEFKPVDSTSWINATDVYVDLDSGLKEDNETNLNIIVAPTVGYNGSASYNAPSITTQWVDDNITYTFYRVEFNSDELWYKPIESDVDFNFPTNTTSRLLFADDVVTIGNTKYIISNPNIGTIDIGGETFYRASLRVPTNGWVRLFGNYKDEINYTSIIQQTNARYALTKILQGGLVCNAISKNETFSITKNTIDSFKHEMKIYPGYRYRGVKQWDVRVTFIDLASERLLSGFKLIESDFIFSQLKGYINEPPVRTTKEHTYLEIKVKASDEINGQLDRVSAIAESYLPVYDSVNQVWKEELSSNPAWVFAGILTNNANQRAVSLDLLDVDSLVEWANYCDNNRIVYQANSIGFECNFVLDYSITVKELLDNVCSSARARLNINNGKYGVIIDEYKTTPTQIFNQRNIQSMQVQRSYVKTADGLRVSYIDPQSNWQKNTVIAYDDGKDVNNSEIIEDVESFGTTSFEQAWRQGRYFLAQHKLRKDNITIKVDFEALACSRGDLVYFSHDVMKSGGTPARVKAINGNIITIDEAAIDQGGTQVLTCRNRIDNTINNFNIVSFPSDNEIELDSVTNIQVDDLCVYGIQNQVIKEYIVSAIRYSDDLQAEIDLVEYNEAIYTADSGDLPEYKFVTVDNPLTRAFIPDPVLNLEYSYNILANQNEKRYIYELNLTWDEPSFGKASLYEIYSNIDGETKLIGYSDSTTFRTEIPGSQLDIEHIYKVVGVNNLGDKVQLAEASYVTLTPFNDTTAPANVDVFNANVLTDVIELDWKQNLDLDIDKYLIRFSKDTVNAQWPLSTPITSTGATQTSVSVPLRTGTYLIRARDYAGNLSPQASRVVTSVPEISKIEFISNVSAPTWNGVFDNTALLGSSLTIKSTDDYASFVDDFGEFFFQDVFDLGDIFTARFIAEVVASGFSRTGLMKNWNTLAEIDPIAGDFNEDDFDAAAYIRTRNEPDVMANWTPLSSVDYLSFGSELTATPWIKFKAGDFTGRIFQLKIRLDSEDVTISPIVYSANIDAHWNERIINGQNVQSGTAVSYEGDFLELPALQVTSSENVQNGDYFLFTSKTVSGFTVQFYDVNDNPVNDRRFDWIAKGVGKKYTLEDINF